MHRLLPWIPDIAQATFIDVQGVADFFWANPKEYWDLNDFNLAPPFPLFATRYKLPDAIYSDERGRIQPDQFKNAEIFTVFRLMDGLPDHKSRGNLPGKEGNVDMRVPMPGAKWYYDIFMFPVKRGEVFNPCYYLMAVNEQGQVAPQKDGVRAFFTAQYYKKFEVRILPVSYLHVSGLALTFIHSKNIKLLPPVSAPKRRTPRDRVFETRYYQIQVRAETQQRERSGEPGAPTGISQSLHNVIGHYSYYGRWKINGNPKKVDTGLLFGKYECAVWIPSHAAGSLDVGVVDKDYKVIPPAESES